MTQARLLPHLVIELERERGGLAEDLERGHVDLDLTGVEVGVLRARRATIHHAGDGDTELVAETMGPLGDLLGSEDHLADAGGVAEIDEDHPAVVPAARHPPGQGDGGPCIGGSELAGGMGAQHYGGPLVGEAKCVR